MDLSPPSLTRSPASPPSTNCSDSPTLDYPSPDFVDPIYKIASMFEQSCATMPNNMGSENSLPPLDVMTSTGWSGTPVMHPSSTSGAPNIMSADYDTFAHYEPSMHASYSHELYSSHPSQASVLSSSTPPPMSSGASRSPDPNSRHAFGYSHSVSPIPRIKMENPNAMAADYGNGAELTQYPSPRSAQSLPLEPSSYGSTAGSSGYLSDVPSGSWPRSEYPSLESDQFYAGPSASGAAFSHDRRQLRVPRTQRRQPRKLTTKEDANFQCEVKGCGKLFSRSYNFKAHMETHDEKREYPFPCTVPDCNKKFVRKTDLQRHNQSVHMKEKNHKCDYCGRMFARKDTLRRHMEDGCSKRFDLGTLDLRAESYDAYPAPTRTLGSTPGHLVAPEAQLPSMTMPQQHHQQHPGSNLLAPMPFTKR
ncbi:uncharacterized protein F4807DRAFT_51422 [Annulohypoxylon truncatum]|uniref:uncharacterized protein n=1 Tax=Annulohypoxylon truncatum TaxID=327061 RepID=UPI0020087D6F|nr:uncharacterized protein F4807DRAFT_51422 [Annulohypoxylon truncatum]KAI1210533.1 hypothetical protein F4807DRAFT_51422 [Annulohypoxylon truncatum]